MEGLKINFVDFWPGFDKTDNYFYKLLRAKYDIEIHDEPEVLFFSCYGNEYLKYKCLRIFYSAENFRPDFTGCDFAITFDFLADPRHYRLPLYAVYIDQSGSLDQLLKVKTKEEALAIWQRKTKFCCIVISNGLAKERVDFFNLLSLSRQVDSGGKWMNNVGGPVKDKITFIKEYKYVIAFENSSFAGYTTEKILDPLLADSIPVYWGNKLVGIDFNSGAFLNFDNYSSAQELIDEMVAIESDPERAVQMLMEPKFPNNKIPQAIDQKNVSAFLYSIIDGRKSVVPVAITWKKALHFYRRKCRSLSFWINKLMHRNFR